MATQRLRVRYSTTLVLASALISGLTVTLSSHGVRVRSPRGGEHVDGSDTGRGILHAAEFPTGARSRIRLDRFAALDGTLGRSRIPSGALRLCLRGGDGESRFLGRDRALEEINAAVEKGVQRGVDMQYVDKTGQVGVKGEEEHTMFQVTPDDVLVALAGDPLCRRTRSSDAVKPGLDAVVRATSARAHCQLAGQAALS